MILVVVSEVKKVVETFVLSLQQHMALESSLATWLPWWQSWDLCQELGRSVFCICLCAHAYVCIPGTYRYVFINRSSPLANMVWIQNCFLLLLSVWVCLASSQRSHSRYWYDFTQRIIIVIYCYACVHLHINMLLSNLHHLYTMCMSCAMCSRFEEAMGQTTWNIVSMTCSTLSWCKPWQHNNFLQYICHFTWFAIGHVVLYHHLCIM